jgi:hypothetical protein
MFVEPAAWTAGSNARPRKRAGPALVHSAGSGGGVARRAALDRLGRAVLVVLVIAVVSVMVVAVDPLLGLVGTLLLLSSVSDFLFPTRFALTEEGIRVRNLLRAAHRRWDRLGVWGARPGGFAIAGRSPSRLLRRLRGVELRCPGREAEVEAVLARRLGAPAGAIELGEEDDGG